MYHNTLITKDHPQQADLEKAIELILAFSGANSIYFSPHLEDGVNQGIIMVIIANDSPHAWDELNDNYWKVFEAFPQFSFRIFDARWVKEELKDGNPFFAMHCTKNSLVYSTAESKEMDYTDRLRPKRFLKKAKSKFGGENHAAFVLGTSVKFYQHRKDYVQAAYNIHQNIRWLFIAASNFLAGEWLVAQDLKIQQRHAGRFAKALDNTFSSEEEEEIQLLELLNAACYAVQNRNEIPELSLELIVAAEAKKEWLRMEVNRLFRECICRCRYEFSRTKSPLIAIEACDPLKVITQIVAETVEVSALYCFGQRNTSRSAIGAVFEGHAIDVQTTHYYLFLIVKGFEADKVGNISYKIKTQTDGRYTATIVTNTKKALYKAEGDQQHFFYQVMQHGQLLYQESARPPFLPFEAIPARNIKSAKMYVQQRNRTVEFLSEAEAMDGGGATKIHVYLMHLIVEQTCLGLIRLFLGYMPNQFSLQFLFELCEYFTPLTAELFPRETEKDKELLKILSGHTTSLRYGFVDDVYHHDYEVLSNRYYEFVERANKLASTELERLEQVNENANINN